MVSHFSSLNQHRTYVLHWYRYTFRNIPKSTNSIHLQNRLKSVIKKIASKHKPDRSSWSIYRLLTQLRDLNTNLVNGNSREAWMMLTPYTKQKKPNHGLKKPITSVVTPQQDPEYVRQMGILNKYITKKQETLQLSGNVCAEYRLKLLLPLALHEHFLRKLHSIEYQLTHGPPSTYLSYTAAGRSHVWFVRSAVNKGERQSKALGRLIRAEKKRGQKNLDYWKDCKNNATWAWEEAVWEHYLDTGSVIKGNPIKYLTSKKNSVSMNEVQVNKLPQKNRADQMMDSKYVYEWLAPIKESLDILEDKSIGRAKELAGYKDKLISSGQVKYFDEKSKTIYQKRLLRYKKMKDDDLPYVVPFIPGRDLPTVMEKHKF